MQELNEMMARDFDRYKQGMAADARRREADLEPAIAKVDAFLIEKQISLGLILGPFIAVAVILAIVLIVLL